MPRPADLTRTMVAAAGAVALVTAFPATALAAHPKPVHKPVHSAPFIAHGLVLRHTASTVTLLASSLKKGKHHTADRTVTVTLPSRHSAAGRALARRLAKTHPGDGIAVSGVARSGHLTAHNLASRPAPFHAYLGTVTAIQDNLVTLSKSGEPSDDAREKHGGSFTVDTSDANVSLDGAPVDGAMNLAVGDTAAVLGSSVDDVVVATSVFGFSTAPGTLAGRVTDTDPADALVTVATRGDHGHRPADGHGGDGGDGGALTQVSLDSATIIVDGQSDAPVTAITDGARILALGSDGGNGTFNAGLAFVFTHGCDSRHHGDGGQGSDDGH